MDSVWCSVGYERICKGSLEAHVVSAGHKAAVDIVKTREGKPWGQPTKARYNPTRLRPKKTREVVLERENKRLMARKSVIHNTYTPF